MASAVLAIVAAVALCSVCTLSSAGPLPGGELQRNGPVSHRLFVPHGAQASDNGMAAGVALGLRGPLRQQLGPVAPALSFGLSPGAKLSVLAAPGKGAMLVLQAPIP